MTSPPVGRVPGVVLAGGRSRRMGRDKATVNLCGRTLLRHTCDRLAPQCASLAISRHAVDADPTTLDYQIIRDEVGGHAGPLAGILAALDWGAARGSDFTHVATAAVDTPFLPDDFVSRLEAARDTAHAPIVCAASGGRHHPVAALWPVAIRDALRSCLEIEGMRRVSEALHRFGFATVEWPAAAHDPFLNVNTPEDLILAEAVAAVLDSATGSGRQ